MRPGQRAFKIIAKQRRAGHQALTVMSPPFEPI
jgi:hypothetical protein